MRTEPRLTYPISKTVRDWLGLTPFETSCVVDILLELASSRGDDVDEMTVAQIRAYADEAFEIYDNHPEYQGFSYKLEG